MTDRTDQDLLAALRPAVREGMLVCKDALAAAEQLGIPPGRIGKICNENEIRIVNCQLGCFGTKRSQPR